MSFDFYRWAHRRLTEGILPNVNPFENAGEREALESLELMFELCLAAVHASELALFTQRTPAVLSLAMSHPDWKVASQSEELGLEALRLAEDVIHDPNTSKETIWVLVMYDDFLSPANKPTASFRTSQIPESEIQLYSSEAITWILNMINFFGSEWGKVGSAFARLTQENEPLVRGLANGDIDRSNSYAMDQFGIQIKVAALVTAYNRLTELAQNGYFEA